MKKTFALICFVFVSTMLFASAQTALVIKSLDEAGTLVFSEATNASTYRVEWAPSANGPWTNFVGESTVLLNNLLPTGSGSVTASVPMFYRVVASVLTHFSVVSSGSSAYLINEESNPTLTLTRGQTYIIEVNSPNHPFWIKFFPSTGTANQYNEGLNTNGVQVGKIIFSVPEQGPDTLYYICQFHVSMQGVIHIVDPQDPNPPAPAGMSLIPAGEFVMGDTFGDGFSNELPLHTNYISAFYMDQYEVTKTLWDEIRTWALTNGYYYSNTGQGKATNHPVYTVNWFDAVKWCNARSEMEGLTPVYYTDAGFTTAYKTGEFAPFANWSANGYRLPTEAEWEKAARGGVAGQRFPWGDTISHSNANYYANPSGYSYDVNPTAGYHPTFTSGIPPYTSPAGNFAPNGYGLYDMSGNVWEWCWDWYSSIYYSSSPSTDPKGPSSGTSRVLRGGSWFYNAHGTRVANRYYLNPYDGGDLVGFRCARGL